MSTAADLGGFFTSAGNVHDGHETACCSSELLRVLGRAPKQKWHLGVAFLGAPRRRPPRRRLKGSRRGDAAAKARRNADVQTGAPASNASPSIRAGRRGARRSWRGAFFAVCVLSTAFALGARAAFLRRRRLRDWPRGLATAQQVRCKCASRAIADGPHRGAAYFRRARRIGSDAGSPRARWGARVPASCRTAMYSELLPPLLQRLLGVSPLEFDSDRNTQLSALLVSFYEASFEPADPNADDAAADRTREFRDLFQHSRACSGTCLVEGCRISRRLLVHYKTCLVPICAVCDASRARICRTSYAHNRERRLRGAAPENTPRDAAPENAPDDATNP
ncbi:hypothetical protein M885DRAFT_615743 [Pelagophyceae sp. CCMP2097]|nr:hypothetical protein M885DRAFT_615743 [Pelagophyceae sp. CCMP2097]